MRTASTVAPPPRFALRRGRLCREGAPGIRGSRATENVAQQVLVRYRDTMPVAVAQKVKMLRVDFRSAAQLADLLGVSRSQVTRWLRGAGIDPLNAEK